MPWAFGAKLTKLLDVFQRNRQLPGILIFVRHLLDTCQVKQTIEQHGSVTHGKDKSISIHPVRSFGIVVQYPGP
eukprot:Skav236574  [mRNA]  locus=scaffold2180:170313:173447:- [translate_table: standard]